MNRVSRLLILLGVFAAIASAEDFVVPPLPTAAQIATAPTFADPDRVVATHYFYWYCWPDGHIFNDADRKSSGLRQHFPDDRTASFLSPEWHREQLDDLLAAGIDIALPVYWGAPNRYLDGDIAFSVRGLPPLAAALDAIAAEGRTPPRIGMFYDTSTLAERYARGDGIKGSADLRNPAGRDLFYRTIRDFFCQVPPRHWACLDGRPIVQLYESGFAAGHDQAAIDYVYEQFAKDFAGHRPFIIAGPAWHVTADDGTGWGAAVNGPLAGQRVAQVGAGYDDSPVPGRTTPTRDRLGGAFYEISWLVARAAQPRLVIIETWDELHEGTGICETLEDGRFYIDITRRCVDAYRAGREPTAKEWGAAMQVMLRGQGSQRAGREFADRLVQTAFVDDAGKLHEEGVRVVAGVDDGKYEHAIVDGAPCLRTQRGPAEHRYVYFDVADPYYYDHHGQLAVRIEYFDDAGGELVLQYDSTADTGDISDRYKEAAQRIHRTNSRTWKTAEFTLPGARAANHQNGGADLRLLAMNSDVAIRRVAITKLPWDYGR